VQNIEYIIAIMFVFALAVSGMAAAQAVPPNALLIVVDDVGIGISDLAGVGRFVRQTSTDLQEAGSSFLKGTRHHLCAARRGQAS
jgi:hypothetical protein